MKQLLLSFLLVLATVKYSPAQTRATYIGPSFSIQSESRSKIIYGPGYEERTSQTNFIGYGLRGQRVLGRFLAVNAGINYVDRKYEMIVPFDHCYFGRPGAPCLMYLAHTDQFGYKAIEVPVGINVLFLNSRKAELYVGLTALAAFTIQSYYKPYIPGLVPGSGRLRHHEVNVFSKSLHGTLGAGYKINEQLKINFEPFYRLAHRQRADPILFERNAKWVRNDFKNFGLLIGINYKI